MKKMKGPVIVLLSMGILWSAAFAGYFVGRHDAVVAQTRLDIQTLANCATLIREGDAQRTLPYIESRLAADVASLLEYRKFPSASWLAYRQLCDALSRHSLKIDPIPSLAAYNRTYPANQLGGQTRDFLQQGSQTR